MIVVDTNVISEAMRNPADSRVIDWMDAQAVETLYLSAVTVAELRFGIAVLPAGKRRDRMRARLEQEVIPVFAARVLPFDMDAAQAYADLMARARRKGKTIGKSDAYIAATAASRGFAVATNNTSPFEAAAVPIVSPWDEDQVRGTRQRPE